MNIIFKRRKLLELMSGITEFVVILPFGSFIVFFIIFLSVALDVLFKAIN